MFEVTNGVKQGGVMSPIIFAVYVDGLFHKLKKSGVGCQMAIILLDVFYLQMM